MCSVLGIEGSGKDFQKRHIEKENEEATCECDRAAISGP